ncbi:unnamed protein product [Pedinophyceae sp. YPF-701]|nr:unnamed protein product [Pedinophyceae sp. YPF-701]
MSELLGEYELQLALHNFRNVGLLNQGFYAVQVKVYDATSRRELPLTSCGRNGGEERPCEALLPWTASRQHRIFQTHVFAIKYRDWSEKLDYVARFPVTIRLHDHPKDQKVIICAQLYFKETTKAEVRAGGAAPPASPTELRGVSDCEVVVSGLSTSPQGFVPVCFGKYFVSTVGCTVHTRLKRVYVGDMPELEACPRPPSVSTGLFSRLCARMKKKTPWERFAPPGLWATPALPCADTGDMRSDVGTASGATDEDAAKLLGALDPESRARALAAHAWFAGAMDAALRAIPSSAYEPQSLAALRSMFTSPDWSEHVPGHMAHKRPLPLWRNLRDAPADGADALVASKLAGDRDWRCLMWMLEVASESVLTTFRLEWQAHHTLECLPWVRGLCFGYDTPLLPNPSAIADLSPKAADASQSTGGPDDTCISPLSQPDFGSPPGTNGLRRTQAPIRTDERLPNVAILSPVGSMPFDLPATPASAASDLALVPHRPVSGLRWGMRRRLPASPLGNTTAVSDLDKGASDGACVDLAKGSDIGVERAAQGRPGHATCSAVGSDLTATSFVANPEGRRTRRELLMSLAEEYVAGIGGAVHEVTERALQHHCGRMAVAALDTEDVSGPETSALPAAHASVTGIMQIMHAGWLNDPPGVPLMVFDEPDSSAVPGFSPRQASEDGSGQQRSQLHTVSVQDIQLSLPEASAEPAGGAHAVVFVHGLYGGVHDLRLIRNEMVIAEPDLVTLMSSSNQKRTTEPLQAQGKRLAEEVVAWLEARFTTGGDSDDKDVKLRRLARLSFVGHSLGTIVIRAAIEEAVLAPWLDKAWMYVSVSGPQLGFVQKVSSLVASGIWVMKHIRRAHSLREMALQDARDVREGFLYNLAQKEGLARFKQVVLLSSPQDGYVPYHSSRMELGPALAAVAADDGEGHGKGRGSVRHRVCCEMIDSILSKMEASGTRLTRVDAVFPLRDAKGLDRLTGRRAHLDFVEDVHLSHLLVWTVLRPRQLL